MVGNVMLCRAMVILVCVSCLVCMRVPRSLTVEGLVTTSNTKMAALQCGGTNHGTCRMFGMQCSASNRCFGGVQLPRDKLVARRDERDMVDRLRKRGYLPKNSDLPPVYTRINDGRTASSTQIIQLLDDLNARALANAQAKVTRRRQAARRQQRAKRRRESTWQDEQRTEQRTEQTLSCGD